MEKVIVESKSVPRSLKHKQVGRDEATRFEKIHTEVFDSSIDISWFLVMPCLP